MRVFYSAQIIERGQNLPIKLVSLGLVRDDGAELYVVNEENLSEIMLNNRLSRDAVQHLPIKTDPSPTLTAIYSWDTEHEEYGHVLPLGRLTEEVRRFLTEADGPVELWSHYAAYTHVALCQLFGSLGELPARIPMLTHDIQQAFEVSTCTVLPPVPADTHHAMADARWVRDAYEFLNPGLRPSVLSDILRDDDRKAFQNKSAYPVKVVSEDEARLLADKAWGGDDTEEQK